MQDNKVHEALFMSEVEKYKGKILCKKCGNYYHPKKFKMCWECYSKQPQRITEGYASIKDMEESEGLI